MPTPISFDDLLGCVQKSGVVDPQRLRAFLSEQSSPPNTPAALANALKAGGLLTHFQAGHLLKGKWRNLVLCGKYTILEPIGAGGMGRVYLCSHKIMDRLVAVKVLPARLASDPSGVERFHREARAVAQLRHPNIAVAHDVDQDGPIHFLVMEYIEGPSLLRLVQQSGQLEPIRAAHYIHQAALGLEHAHEAGIVHRDVKPDNIHVDRDGTVKVLDLGLARFFRDGNDSLTQRLEPGAVLGTADYLAPEQALNSQNASPRADIYSLGLTFYFLLAGRTAVQDGSVAQKLLWHQMRESTPIATLRPDVPEGFSAILAKMTAKDPAQRYQTMSEVAEALAPWTQTPIPPPAEEEIPPSVAWEGGRRADGIESSRPRPAGNSSRPPAPARSVSPSAYPKATRSAPRKSHDARVDDSATQIILPEDCANSSPAQPRRPLKRWQVGAIAVLAGLVTSLVMARLWPAPRSVAVGPGDTPSNSVAVGPGDTPSSTPRVKPKLTPGAVLITQEGSDRRIYTERYEATVSADGYMPSLRIDGVEVLKPNVNVSRGVYLLQWGNEIRLSDLKQPTATSLSTECPHASIRYDFAPDKVTWSVENRTGLPMSYFGVFDKTVTAVRNQANEWHISPTDFPSDRPIDKKWATTTWFAGKARFKVIGGTKVWGPWEEYQVWEASLAPREQRVITVEIGQTDAAEAERVAQVTGVKPKPPADLTLDAPLDYQVFQRRTKLQGAVTVRGQCRLAPDRLEVRMVGTPLEGPLPDGWQNIPTKAGAATFERVVATPAGGWYKLEVRALKEGKVVAQATVDHVGVGDIFVGAGQSNSTNCGEQRIQQASGMVSSFNGTKWQLADDPQLGVHDNSRGGSPWPAFGDAMYAKYRVPIGVASTGHSGTGIDQWAPGGELFRWTTGRMKQLGKEGFQGVLWHQGEADVNMSADDYARKMTAVIRESRREVGWEVPWFVAQVSYHNPNQTSYPGPRAGQKKLWDAGVAFEGPDTDTLGGDNRDLGGKGIHFSPKGLRAHGKLWADKVAVQLDKKLAQ